MEGARVVLAGLTRDTSRLSCGQQLGIDRVVDVEKEDVVEVLREMSGGPGADLVYECSGSAASLASCWDAVRKQGTVVSLGVYAGPIQTDFRNVMMKELTVIGSYGYVWTSWQRTVKLLGEGKLKLEPLISHELPLEEFARGFADTQSGSAIKVVLNPELPA
jgi:L-iditol 2-dehydrogenase